MAPATLLPESPPPHYSQPAKSPAKRDAGVSLEAHTPVSGNHTFAHPPSNGTSSSNGLAHGTDGSPTMNSHSRRQLDGRDFVTSQALLQNSRAYASHTQSANGVTKRPNLLYIMADQMAAPLLKMNDPASVIKTPHLDELARTGVNFASAYCNSPLCAPSRFTMCTGQLPSKIGGYDNASILSPEVPTYAHYLRREGYETALAGKMHFIGPDQLHGFEHR